MIITLTTDIGWEYAAEMKGIITSINPEAKIVDVTHDIMPQNIMQGAFVIYSIVPYFKNAIHIGVVDPGVGTKRKSIAIECKNAWFVGPDNGMFYPAIKKLGIKRVYELKVKKASPVFHGRDVFAPAAAMLSMGKKPDMKEIHDFIKINFPDEVREGNRIEGKILFIDRFGNIITNIRQPVQKNFRIRIKGIEKDIRLLPSYGYAGRGEIIAVISSAGFLEIARREGSAAEYFSVMGSEPVEIFL